MSNPVPATITILSPSSVTPGAGIALTEMETLRAYRPQWAQETESNTVRNWMFDEETPKVAYVHPPAGTATYVELVLETDPTECATTGDNIPLADFYASPLIDYIMARAMETDIEGGADFQRAGYYWQAYREKLGLKTEREIATSPNTSTQDGAKTA